MKNPYQSIEANLEDVILETPTIKTFVLRPKQKIGFETGQFIEVSVPGLGEAPFTPSSDPKIEESLDVTIMNVGRVTQKLHAMAKNTRLGLRGPYGKGYPLDEFQNREILIVGGGVGLAPLRSLIFTLFGQRDKYKKIVIRYGARTPADILYKETVSQWGKKKDVNLKVTVDNGAPGWKGHVGLVTTILDDLPINIKKAVGVVCGPPIMMKFVTFKLLDLGFSHDNIYLSMEKNMSCGLGKCGHCRLGKFYICKDGPVFTYSQIKDIHDIWD